MGIPIYKYMGIPTGANKLIQLSNCKKQVYWEKEKKPDKSGKDFHSNIEESGFKSKTQPDKRYNRSFGDLHN